MKLMEHVDGRHIPSFIIPQLDGSVKPSWIIHLPRPSNVFPTVTQDHSSSIHPFSHTSGVSGWDEPMTLEDLCGLPESTAALARQTPWWKPDTGSGYHSWTFGHLLGELVRRITGKSLKNYIMKEIAGPLDADFQIGVEMKNWHRAATLVPPSTHGHKDLNPDLSPNTFQHGRPM